MQLGNDIAGMSEVIHSRSSDLSGETSRLAGFVADVTNNLRDLKVRQKKTTGGVLRGTHNIVESLGELSARSGDEVRKIKASAQVVTTSIQSLVTSIQYQDITRQAMDRIREELKELQDGGIGIGGIQEVAGRENLSGALVVGEGWWGRRDSNPYALTDSRF